MSKDYIEIILCEIIFDYRRRWEWQGLEFDYLIASDEFDNALHHQLQELNSLVQIMTIILIEEDLIRQILISLIFVILTLI